MSIRHILQLQSQKQVLFKKKLPCINLRNTTKSISTIEKDTKVTTIQEEDWPKYVPILKSFIVDSPLTRGFQLNPADVEPIFIERLKTFCSSGLSFSICNESSNEIMGVIFGVHIIKGRIIRYDKLAEETQNSKLRNYYLFMDLMHNKTADYFEGSKDGKIFGSTLCVISEKYRRRGLATLLIKEQMNKAKAKGYSRSIFHSLTENAKQTLSSAGIESLGTIDYASFKVDGKCVFDVSKTPGARQAVIGKVDL